MPVFFLVSFEGPDGYALAGGLGQRVRTLAAALAAAGVETHHFFVGDPDLPGEEETEGGRLTLHRWAQWVSRYHPAGVYAGEEDKRREVTASLPPRLVAAARAVVAQGRRYRMLFEDWQCAEVALATWQALEQEGLLAGGRGVVAHNTNTLMQVERARLPELQGQVLLLTVSRFMKHALWRHGVNPMVVPNGLPPSAFAPPDAAAVAAVSALAAAERTVLVKVARFDPDKGWLAALETVDRLRRAGRRPLLLMRGGIEAHGADVLARAGDLGLRVRESFVGHEVPSPEEAEGADVWLYRARIPDAVLRGLYRAAHAVLAQSGLEPFGLVGLEAMAQGGLVLTGASGEDYARHRWNALVVESGGSWEVAHLIERGLQDPDLVRSIRRAAQETAAAYTWERLVPELLERMAMAERWG